MMGGVTGGNKGTMQDFPSLLLLFGCHLVVGEDDHHHDDDDEDDHDDDGEDDHDDDDEDVHDDDPNLEYYLKRGVWGVSGKEDLGFQS